MFLRRQSIVVGKFGTATVTVEEMLQGSDASVRYYKAPVRSMMPEH